ncbi:hypothetical protein LPC10_23270 [Methylorubrum sp. B1-46]|uniref:hypothetical protein n=1 Tax=Methylorubrum sp. B1-46 TaxID=2897334 RepID=UPI001E3071A3|nr:hypothetical protein [Methylorubrum sp. B1-46]UGB25763.1 hypothetical protein LPC10_23270 [Methylorubrum sp. B1-46]
MAFGRMVVASRDRVFDAASGIAATDGGDSIANIVAAAIARGTFDRDDAVDVAKHYIDRFIVELMYEVQDAGLNHGCDLALVAGSRSYVLTDLSDGLAGEFMTEDGWFRRLSLHRPSRFDPD